MTTNGESNGLPEYNLRYIYRADFRKSEATLLEEAKLIVDNLRLQKGDCLMLLSGTEKVIKFVFGYLEDRAEMAVDRVGKPLKNPPKILHSKTYRITGGGTFHPLMLANYAEEMGINLKGLKKLQTYLRLDVDEQKTTLG